MTSDEHLLPSNRLAGQDSPYLLQHVHNPVAWYPWGEEAFRAARDADLPIFLSIGYSACHWCHVMAHESFEDPEIARILNEHFVSIKVDREELPDVDEVYMTSVQIMTGSGGWPLSVFLTPAGRPFYGGTYFPPESRFGIPSFRTVLTEIARLWREKRDEVDRGAEELTEALQAATIPRREGAGRLEQARIAGGVRQLRTAYDAQWGGFGKAPKFPPSGAIDILLRNYRHSGDLDALKMATHTLDQMAAGGMYDHVGGGFHRYSTDARWLVPHFEKMLYDNALLSRVYVDAFQLTRNPFYRQVAEEVFEYALRDMKDPTGGFHSAEDADSEGVEGRFYVWTADEIRSVLADDADLFMRFYGVTPGGNFEGKSILYRAADPLKMAASSGLDPAEFERRLKGMRDRLWEERAKRVRPGKDDKVLVSWNAMMISALCRGAQVLEVGRFAAEAASAMGFLLRDLSHDGELGHMWRRGQAKGVGYLDDYAWMATALIDLYETLFQPGDLSKALELAERMVVQFWDEDSGMFFLTSSRHSALPSRTCPMADGATPSGNSVAAGALLRLGRFLDRKDLLQKAEQVLQSNTALLSESPRAATNLLAVLDMHLDKRLEIVIAGDPGDPATQHLLRVVHAHYLPNRILALRGPSRPGDETIPLLEGKERISGRPAAYVCENYACREPVTEPELLDQILSEKQRE